MKPDLSAVHPELQRMARMVPPMVFNAKTLRWWRLLHCLTRPSKPPADMRIENLFIPAQDAPRQSRLRVYRRQAASPNAPALLWLHGGGYLLGSPEQCDLCCLQYARELGIVVVSVDYRWAPEHPFPKPLEDGYAALQWVHAHAAQLGIEAGRIAIGGESAGGGLAAALVQYAHDRQAIRPVFQLLVYPMLDDRTTLHEDAYPDRLTWNQESNRFGWQAYLGRPGGAADIPPYAVPARREDLRGLPPAWIGVGSLDLFHDEDVAYGQRLNACGVTCEVYIVPGGFHGFDIGGPGLNVVREFRQSQVEALRRHLCAGTSVMS